MRISFDLDDTLLLEANDPTFTLSITRDGQDLIVAMTSWGEPVTHEVSYRGG